MSENNKTANETYKVTLANGTELYGKLLVQTEESAVMQTEHGRLTVPLDAATLEPYSDGADWQVGQIAETARGVYLKVANNKWRLLIEYITNADQMLTDRYIQRAAALDWQAVHDMLTTSA